MMVYVVVGSWKDYDESDTWIVKAFTTREVAESFASDCRDEAAAVASRYKAIYEEFRLATRNLNIISQERIELGRIYNERLNACIGKLDTHDIYGYEVKYAVEEIEVHET